MENMAVLRKNSFSRGYCNMLVTYGFYGFEALIMEPMA